MTKGFVVALIVPIFFVTLGTLTLFRVFLFTEQTMDAMSLAFAGVLFVVGAILFRIATKTLTLIAAAVTIVFAFYIALSTM